MRNEDKTRLEYLYAQRASFEMTYERTDRARLHEFVNGGITKTTIKKHVSACRALENNYNEIQKELRRAR